jgi:hypothetical protein
LWFRWWKTSKRTGVLWARRVVFGGFSVVAKSRFVVRVGLELRCILTELGEKLPVVKWFISVHEADKPV